MDSLHGHICLVLMSASLGSDMLGTSFSAPFSSQQTDSKLSAAPGLQLTVSECSPVHSASSFLEQPHLELRDEWPPPPHTSLSSGGRQEGVLWGSKGRAHRRALCDTVVHTVNKHFAPPGLLRAIAFCCSTPGPPSGGEAEPSISSPYLLFSQGLHSLHTPL